MTKLENYLTERGWFRVNYGFGWAHKDHESTETFEEAVEQAFETLSKRNAQLEAVAQELWMLLDNIDTADDMAKFDNELYRKIAQRNQARRWELGVKCDGYTLDFSEATAKLRLHYDHSAMQYNAQPLTEQEAPQ